MRSSDGGHHQALPEEFARDEERIGRLEREARLLAATVHDPRTGLNIVLNWFDELERLAPPSESS